MRRPRRVGGAGILAALLLVGCDAGASPVDPAAPLAPLPDVAAGTTASVFAEDDVEEPVYRFGIYGAAELPDGTALVAYDVAYGSAGDETPTDPRFGLVGADGRHTPLDPPVIDGRPLPVAPYLLTSAPDGTTYFRNGFGGNRLFTRSPVGEWREFPSLHLIPRAGIGPDLTVATDGTLYALDGAGIERVAPDGSVTRVVTMIESSGSASAAAGPAPLEPVTAADAVVDSIYSVVVGDDGTIFALTRYEVIAIDPAGQLHVLTTRDDLNVALGLGGETNWGDLALDADGSLLIGTRYYGPLATVDPPRVVARDIALLPSAQHAARSATGDLLVTSDADELLLRWGG